MEGKIEITAAAGGAAAPSGEVKPTGNKVEFTMSFEMSNDFKTYAFNALSGPDSNPDIKVKSGDTVTIHVKNPTKSFHAFGIVSDVANPSDILWNSAVATPDNPLKPGKSGDVTFVAGAPGTYHYICTVPGHAELGMQGKFIVE
jgi:nitrite reductase (NO-forming)